MFWYEIRLSQSQNRNQFFYTIEEGIFTIELLFVIYMQMDRIDDDNMFASKLTGELRTSP